MNVSVILSYLYFLKLKKMIYGPLNKSGMGLECYISMQI